MNNPSWIRRNWLSVVVALLPFVILTFVWAELPDRVPQHWNARGEVDRYGPKASLLLVPFITWFVLGIFWAVPYLDPKKNTPKFEKVIDRIALGLAVFMLAIFSMVIIASLGTQIDVGNFVILAVLGLFLFLGNLFGKLRPNYFIGIRTPWTLESESNWRKTHRLSSYIWVGGSLLMILLKFFISSEQFLLPFFVFVGLITLVPIAYSFWLFKQDQKEKTQT